MGRPLKQIVAHIQASVEGSTQVLCAHKDLRQRNIDPRDDPNTSFGRISH